MAISLAVMIPSGNEADCHKGHHSPSFVSNCPSAHHMETTIVLNRQLSPPSNTSTNWITWAAKLTSYVSSPSVSLVQKKILFIQQNFVRLFGSRNNTSYDKDKWRLSFMTSAHPLETFHPLTLSGSVFVLSTLYVLQGRQLVFIDLQPRTRGDNLPSALHWGRQGRVPDVHLCPSLPSMIIKT